MDPVRDTETNLQQILQEQKRLSKELAKLERRNSAKARTRVKPRGTRTRWKKAVLKIAGILLLSCIIVPPYTLPVHGPVTSGFFIRTDPQTRGLLDLEIHEGIDIDGATGDLVRAAKSGTVTAAGWSESLGNYVEVRHWLGFSTRYGHLDSLSVQEGSFVLKGLAVLGRMGSTGRSTGSHLHFEVRWNGRALPPEIFLVFARVRSWLLGI